MNWVGAYPQGLETYALKKDAPALDAGERIVRIEFRFCSAFVVLNVAGDVRAAGRFVPTFQAYLEPRGHVIGLRDANAAEGHPCAEAWRNAYHDRVAARLAFAERYGL